LLQRAELAFLAVWAGTTIGLALLRRRFEGYAVVPLAILAAWSVREGVAYARSRWRSAPRWIPLAWPLALLALCAPGLPVVATGAVAELPAQAGDRFPLYRYLRTLPSIPGREGVLASWSDGHEIQWLAGKPVVATPFGTDIDPSSVQDQVIFFLASDPAAAEALARRGLTVTLVARGAQLRFNADPADPETWSKPVIPIVNGYGYIDMAWDPSGAIWAGGGNATLLVSRDGGSTWQKDPVGSGQPTNFSRITFTPDGKGFALGERGGLLRWVG